MARKLLSGTSKMLSMVTPSSRFLRSATNQTSTAIGVENQKPSSTKAKQQVASEAEDEEEEGEKFDPDQVLYSDDILSDLWIYLTNNNILFGVCLADARHPFSRFERKFSLIVYFCACVTLASIIAHHSHVCVPSAPVTDNAQAQPNEAQQKDKLQTRRLEEESKPAAAQKVNTNAAPVPAPVASVMECSEQATIMAYVTAFVGAYVLRKFFNLLARCSRIDDDASDYNIVFRMLCKLLAKQTYLVLAILAVILLVKGVVFFIKNGIGIQLIVPYVISTFAVSIGIMFVVDVWQYFRIRHLQVRFKTLKEMPEDPYKEMRGQNKRNFYIA